MSIEKPEKLLILCGFICLAQFTIKKQQQTTQSSLKHHFIGSSYDMILVIYMINHIYYPAVHKINCLRPLHHLILSGPPQLVFQSCPPSVQHLHCCESLPKKQNLRGDQIHEKQPHQGHWLLVSSYPIYQ